MLNINKQVFNALMVSLLIAAPVMAADGSTASGADGGAGRMVASKKLECSGGAGGHGPRMNLSDAQLQKMVSLKDQFLDKTGSERTELCNLHRQLKEVLSSSSIDRSRAEGIQAKINSIKDQLSIQKLDLRLDEISTLTPEQREQMQHRMLIGEAFGGHHGGHHRHGGGRRFEHGPSGRQEKA
jgi:Spy/CpxP family protein refolding chaperone